MILMIILPTAAWHGEYIFLLIFLGLPIFTKIPPSLATSGERTTFQAVCQAEGFPRPVVNWTRLVMPLASGKTKIIGGTLTIKNLRPADSGYYFCVASNAMGTKKVRIDLVVQTRRSGTSLVQLGKVLNVGMHNINSCLCYLGLDSRASVIAWFIFKALSLKFQTVSAYSVGVITKLMSL